MLRSRVVAWSCLAILSAGPVRAEAVKAELAPALGLATEATKAEAVKTPEDKSAEPASEKSAAATPETTAAAPIAEPAPAVSPASPASEAAKAAEPAKPVPPPEPTLTAAIDLAQQTISVSENGAAKYTWPISSGTAEFPTPRGTFRAQWTAKMWYSRKYDNAPMPHAVFINGGVAIHATYHTGALGRPASHGCIRLSPANARTFYGLVQKHGTKLTKVSVYGTPKWRGPAIASRSDSRKRRLAAAQQDSGWFWGGSSYDTTSAYDSGFAAKRYRKPVRQYNYANVPPPRVYRRYNGQRVVYVQRPPRKVYYYNNSGYGYGGGGW